MDGKQLIRAYAKAAITKLFGKCFQITDIPVKAIEKNKIIATALHLGKRYFHRVTVNPSNLKRARLAVLLPTSDC